MNKLFHSKIDTNNSPSAIAVIVGTQNSEKLLAGNQKKCPSASIHLFSSVNSEIQTSSSAKKILNFNCPINTLQIQIWARTSVSLESLSWFSVDFCATLFWSEIEFCFSNVIFLVFYKQWFFFKNFEGFQNTHPLFFFDQ